MEKEHHCLNSLKNIFREIIYCNTKEIPKVNQNNQLKKINNNNGEALIIYLILLYFSVTGSGPDVWVGIQTEVHLFNNLSKRQLAIKHAAQVLLYIFSLYKNMKVHITPLSLMKVSEFNTVNFPKKKKISNSNLGNSLIRQTHSEQHHCSCGRLCPLDYNHGK